MSGNFPFTLHIFPRWQNVFNSLLKLVFQGSDNSSRGRDSMTSLITLITIALLLIFWVGTTHALRKSNKGIQLSKKEVYLTWIAGIARDVNNTLK